MKRCRHEIIAEILWLCNDKPMMESRLLYGAGISHTQYADLVPKLVKRGFLKIENKGRKKLHKTTNEGKIWLKTYHALQKFSGEIF